MNFGVIFYSLLFFLLFLFLGLGLTILLCPKEWRKYTIFLSPVIGYCLLTLAGWYFYSLNFKGTDSYYYWILLISLLLLVAAAVKVWKQKILKELFSRELIIPIVLAAIIFILVAIPSLKQKEMTSLSLGNNDIASYSFYSKVLQEMPKSDFHVIDYFVVSITDQELGGYINTPFFSSVVKLAPYQVQMINLYIFFILSLFFTYILGREVFKYSKFSSNIIVLLCGLNSVFYYVIFHGFERQVIAVPLMLLFMLLSVAVIQAKKFKDALPYVPFLVLTLWGLSLTYSQMILIVYALFVPYVAVSCWKDRKAVKLLNWAAISGIALLVTFGLDPSRLPLVIENTIYNAGANNGWFIPWVTPQKLFGLTSFVSTNNSISISIVIFIALTAVIIAGFIKLLKSDMKNLLFPSITFSLIFAGTLVLAVRNIGNTTNGGFGGYSQFKLISFFLPLLLLCSFTMFQDLTFSMRDIRKKLILYIVITALVAGNCLSAGSMISTAVHNVLVIPHDTTELQTLQNNTKISSINIPADNGAYWNIMWEAYFLIPKALYFEQATYYGATPLIGEWSLIRNGTTSSEKVLSTLYKAGANTIRINSTYSLTKSNQVLSVKYGGGWSSYEPDHRWTDSANASIIINTVSDNISVSLSFKCSPLNKQNSFLLYFNNVEISESDITFTQSSSNEYTQYTVKILLLQKGENIIEFRAKLPPEQPPGNGDPRLLCYSFKSIQIEEIE